ncbi:MAG: type IV secretory system conjugative DNA transfer family protein [Rhizomicrobium sp.]
MRLVVGQQKHSIDFRKAMDEGEIVIVNLGSRHAFSYENARVLGTLLINDLFLTALSRDEAIAAKRPFTLYLDEAYDFLSPDIERILDQTRKFGLHAVLAHQRIGQIKARGEGVYNAVMGGTQTKIVLGGLGDDDASIMAREIMRGDVELATPKPGLTMPVVIGEEPFWLESESSSEGVSRNYSTTTGASSGEGKTETTSSVADGEEGSSTEGSSSTISETMSVTEGRSTSSSRTRGRSQTLRSIREERPAHLYSLEESFHLAALALRNLPDRAAIVKRRGHRTVRVETIEVKPMLKMPDTAARFRDMVCERSPFVVGIAAAEAEIRERQAALSPRRAESGSDDSSFWHEEA